MAIIKNKHMSISTNLIQNVRKAIMSYGGYLSVHEEDTAELQIYDGDMDGEAHGVVAINKDGVEMDDGDFYPFDELLPEDLRMVIDYIDWKINN